MIRKSKREKSVIKDTKDISRPEKFKGMLRFEKIHGGIHNNRDGQIVRKGEILYAHSVSPVIASGWKCLDDQKGISTGISLGIKARGNGWFDVINKITGEKLNEDAMRAKDAKQFIEGDLPDEDEEKDEEKEEELNWSDLDEMNEEELLDVSDKEELTIPDDEWETEDDLRVIIAAALKIDIPTKE